MSPRHSLRRVYIAHPLGNGSEREANRIAASKWVVWAAEQGAAPCATWIILSGAWDESRRKIGMAIDKREIDACDEVWLCGPRVSPGMQEELEYAELLDMNVCDLTGLTFEQAVKELRDYGWKP